MHCPKCGHPLTLDVLDSQDPDLDSKHCPACNWHPEEECCDNCANIGTGECDDCREYGNSNWGKKA